LRWRRGAAAAPECGWRSNKGPIRVQDTIGSALPGLRA
jgi:hypothetical protein